MSAVPRRTELTRTTAREPAKGSTASPARLSPGLSVRMADGAALRTDLHLPTGEGPFPVCLIRTPYGSRTVGLLQLARVLTGRGVAVVIQNVRGRYGSEGHFEPFRHEIEDGRSTLEWLDRQPWSSSNVVLFGSSYAAYAALATATSAFGTEHRVTGVIALSSIATPRKLFYRQGAFLLHWALPWAVLTDGPRQTTGGEKIDWHALGRRPRAEILDAIPDAALHAPEATRRRWRLWAELGASDDDDWTAADLLSGLRSSPVPTLHVAGWYDFVLPSSLDLVSELEAAGLQPDQELIVGPWSHEALFPALLRGLLEEDAADPTASEVARRVRSRLGAWLGIETGETSTVPGGGVHLWRNEAAPGRGRWDHFASLEAWRAGQAESRLYLHPAGPDGTSGRLTPSPSPAESWSEWRHRPEAPVAGPGGRCWSMTGWTEAGPLDRSATGERPDVLTFFTDPLDRDLVISGEPRLELLACEEPAVGEADTTVDYCATLVDVTADGRSVYVADGVARLPSSHRARRVRLSLGPVHHLFRKGHRLGLQVAASSFPQFDCVGPAGARRLAHGPSGSLLQLPRTGVREAGTVCIEEEVSQT